MTGDPQTVETAPAAPPPPGDPTNGLTDAHYNWAQNFCGIDTRAVDQSADPNAGQPNQSVDPSAGQPNQSADPNAGPPNQSGDPNTGQPNQSVDPNAGPPNQSADPNAVQPNQSVDPNAGPPNQSVDPNADQPNQSVDPNAGQPNQSADPNASPPYQLVDLKAGDPDQSVSVDPPASGVPAGQNPYGGTPLEQPWTQGFKDGFAEPETSHSAPSPYTPDAQTAYSEGVLAGMESVKGTASPNRSEGPATGTQDNAPQAAPDDNSTGARFIKVFQKVGEKYGPDVVSKLQSLNVAELVAFAAVFLLIEDTPVGWVGMVAGAAMIGKEIADVIDDVSAFISITSDPKGDLDDAASHLSAALSRLSIDALIIFLTHKASGKVKPWIKPSSGLVDVMTIQGQVFRVPADKMPETNASLSEGSGKPGREGEVPENKGGGLQLKTDGNTGLQVLDGAIDLSKIDADYLSKLSPEQLTDLADSLEISIRNRQAGQEHFGETADDGSHRARIGQEQQLLRRVNNAIDARGPR